MGKALMRIGYNNYAMDVSDAVAMMEILGRAEMYQAKRDYKVTPTVTSYHVWGQEPDNDTLSIHCPTQCTEWPSWPVSPTTIN